MAGEMSLSLSANFNSMFSVSKNNNNINLSTVLEQSINFQLTGGDILDISVEGQTMFKTSTIIEDKNKQEDIYNDLKAMDPKLAKKYLAVRQLLLSVSKDAVKQFDNSIKSILGNSNRNGKTNNQTVSNNIETVSSLETTIKVRSDQGEVYEITLSLTGSISISSGSNTKTKDPILIDLDNNGIAFDNEKQFDIDEDGKAETVNWISKNDGVLFADYDKNGKISSMNEMFGDSDKFSTGIEKLLFFDQDNNKVINSFDNIFKYLKIEKGDGSILTMKDLQITEIVINGQTISLKSQDKNYSGGDYLFEYKDL